MSLLSLKESKPGFPLVLHDEPIYCNKKIVGRTTSGNYSFNYNKKYCFCLYRKQNADILETKFGD